MTSRASLGSGSAAFASINRVSRSLVERAPVDADAHGLVVGDGDFDHRLKILIVMLAGPDVAGIDAILGQRSSALGILFQQDVTVIVKVSDDGNGNSALAQPFDDMRNRGRGLASVDGDAHKLRAGARELLAPVKRFLRRRRCRC